MLKKYFSLIVCVILLVSGCDFETQDEISTILTEDKSEQSGDPNVGLNIEAKNVPEGIHEASIRWIKSNMTVDEILKELRETVLTSEDSLLSLDRMFSVTTKLKSNLNYDFGNLSSDQSDMLFRNRLLPLRFDGRMQLFEDYRHLRTDVDSLMYDLGKDYLQTGEMVQNGFENDFEVEHFLMTIDSLLSLQEEAENTILEERVKMLQGTFLMSSFGNKESDIYSVDGGVDKHFLKAFRGYRESVIDEPYIDFLDWLDKDLNEHDYRYSSDIQADMRMIQVFGTNFDQYMVNRMADTQGKETLHYYDFVVSPYDTSKFINDLTKTIETDIKTMLGFSAEKDKSFYMSQSVGTANSDILSALFYGEVLTDENESMVEKQSYLIDLESREMLTLKDVFPHSYESFVEKLNTQFRSQYSGKLVDENDVDITKNIPFYLSGDYIYFELSQSMLTDEAKYQTSFWVNLYDYIEHIDLDRIGR